MKADERDTASPDEVSKAISALTALELRKLQRFGRFRMAGLGGLSRGRDYEDLLDEAMTATLDGRRTWRKSSVTFVNHLVAVMRSTSDNWATKEDQREVVEAELHGAAWEDDEDDDLLCSLEPTQAGQEEQVIEKEVLETLEAAISDDPIARDVLSAQQLGLKGQDLKEFLGITEAQLRAAVKKIDRRAQGLQPLFAAFARRKE